jgi:hypothetical protein
MADTPFTNGHGQAYEMSRRIDDLGVQMRSFDSKLDQTRMHLDNKLDDHKIHVDTKLDEIITTLAEVKEAKAVDEAAIKVDKEDRERALKARTFVLEMVSAFALIASVFASAVAAHVI